MPEPALEAFFQELLRSATTLELLVGVYRCLKPALISAMQRHRAEANPLVDQPSLRLLRFILLEEEEQVAWGDAAIALLSQQEDVAGDRTAGWWEEHLRRYLGAAGGVSGSEQRPADGVLPPRRAVEPFEPVRKPQRDRRFSQLWNSRGVGPDPSVGPEEHNWFLLYVRLTEMHVPELLALILYDWKDQPWELYHDLARHLWDEARHAMMGEVAFQVRGVDWFEVPHEISFAEFPNTMLEPRTRAPGAPAPGN